MSALTGRRVLLTRSAEDCAEWAERFAAHGAQPVSLPCIRTELIDTPAVRATLAATLPTADWLVVTSQRGVAAFRALHGAALPERTRVAAVGASTADAARAAIGRVDVVGGGTAQRLAASLVQALDGTQSPRVLLVLAANAGDVLTEALTAAGARCTRCDVYRTVPAAPQARKQALSALGADNIVLASPSAVEGLVHQVELDVPAAVYTIGPTTTAAARAHGLDVAGEARQQSLEGILEVMQCPQ